MVTPTHPQKAPRPAIHLEFQHPPANGMALLKSLLARRPAQAEPDDLNVHFTARWQGAQANAARLRQYREVCGLTDTAFLPPLYLHAMAMPLHMAILSHPGFPLRLLGLVHLGNHMDMLHPIDTAATLTMQCSLQGITPTDRGQSFTMHTTLHQGEALVWSESSTFLSPLPASQRKKSPAQAGTAANSPPTDWGEALARWEVAGHAGRRFARPSGDWNPIHLSAATARLFGYRSAIGHGMYSAARCLYMLQAQQGSAARPHHIALRFKRPLPIPGAVALHTAPDLASPESTHFLLRVLAHNEPHLEGSVRWMRT